MLATATFDEKTIGLREGDHCALYTQGLLEARRTSGETLSFELLDALFATRHEAPRANEAAVDFGQDDDIIVLTLTHLVRGEKASSHHLAPALTA